MPAKANVYTSAELDFAEAQILSWRTYVEAHPFEGLKDRIEWKPTKGGGLMPMVVASIEQQGKFLQETIKNYLLMLDIVEKLREKEALKVTARGGKEVKGGMMARMASEITK